MNNRNIGPFNPWRQTESWWKASDRYIQAPRLQWSRPLLQRLRELRQRGSDGLGRVTW